ncbi:MAG: glycine cleavage system protein GcvH [Myxococcota bacterium]
MAHVPADLQYTREHEWARLEGELVRIGITSHAVEQLGDVTLVDLPPVGSDVQSHERFGDIESVKAVSELFCPISGEVVEINADLESSPELVNEAPYEQGWMMLIRPSDPNELSRLMDASAYEEFVGSLEG